MTTIAATATVTALTPPFLPRPAGPRLGTAQPGAGVSAEAGTVTPAEARVVAPRFAARAASQRFRGRRILAFVLSGFAGLGILSLGALTSQIVAAINVGSLSAAEQQVVGTLLRVAPFVMLLGLAQILSALAVLRDRPRAMVLGLTSALLGAASAAVGIAVLRLGSASAVTGAANTPSTDLVNLLAWTLGLDILAALAIRRIILGRAEA